MTTERKQSSYRIINGRRFESGQFVQSQTIDIVDGRIVGIDSDTNASDSARIIDAQDQFILPGMIDLNFSLREPGLTRNGTIRSETLAAASNGFTKVCSCPNTRPVNDTKAVTQLILEQTESGGACTVLPLGALTKNLEGEQLASFAALKDAGCVALSNGFNPIKNLLVTQRCFEYASSHDMTVMLNPIEPSLHQGVMHEGPLSTQLGLKGIPSTAETIAVGQLIELAKVTGVTLHLSQLSCAGSVELIKTAKAAGLKISCDVAISQLLFADSDVGYFDSLFHAMPPFRSPDDRAALLQGVINGTIDAITSAHQPWEAAEKLRPFAETSPGLSTIELIVPIAMLLEKQGLPLSRFVECFTTGPAAVLGLSTPGISEQSLADLCILNPSAEIGRTQYSVGQNHPLGAIEKMNAELVLKGRVELTMCEGQTTFSTIE